ncbi:MAG: hypothetical protein WD030_06640 [Pirellulales bacterium]
MIATQTPQSSRSGAVNRKAVGPVKQPAKSSRVQLQRTANPQADKQQIPGRQAARDFLPQSWWPVESRLAGAEPIAPPVRVQPSAPMQPANPIARQEHPRLLHPREIIAGGNLAEQPFLDDSEGRADPIGRTLSGATPHEAAGAEEVAPEDPPSNDNAETDSSEEAEQAIQPEAEQAETHEDELDENAAAKPLRELKPLTPEQITLRNKIRHVRAIYRQKLLNTRDHGHWETMHAIVAYGVDAEIRVGSPYGRKANAIGWICWNGQSARERMFLPRGEGFQPRNGPGLQGHDGQLLAILAQARVKDSYPMRIGGHDFTIADLVRYEQATCEPNTELTFKLIGLNRYLDPDASWTDRRGRDWSLERLVEEELKQPIVGAACGGTHRLFGLTYAYQRREALGLPVTGHFQRAKIFINDYQKYAWRLQNSDGSFSSNWFAGRGDNRDIDRKLQTSGHISEWLAFSLPTEELESQRMQRAISFVADSLGSQQSRDWRIGPLGHALNALRIYDDRVFKPHERNETPGPTADAEKGETAAGTNIGSQSRSARPRQNPYASAIAAGRESARQKQEGSTIIKPANEARPPAGPRRSGDARVAEQAQLDGPQLIAPR